jgi:large subunit ribosomal protein L18
MAATKNEARVRRHARVRKKIVGTPERPRLAVFRSNRHIYAQLIDDRSATTLVAASDREVGSGKSTGAKGSGAKGSADDGKVAPAKEVGKLLAGRAKEAGIERAVFDRGGRLYHGRVAAVAEGAREGGLQI